jgi:hypothetical protein
MRWRQDLRRPLLISVTQILDILEVDCKDDEENYS